MIGGGGGGGGDAYANFLEECESDSDDDILWGGSVVVVD
jgi:ABC-type Fe3+ transport system substrate-binding protein